MNEVLTEFRSYVKNHLNKIRLLKLFQYYYQHVLPGRKTYLRLAEKYGEDCRIYINHYPGTGDVYITSSLLPAWAKKNNVEKYVVTVIGKGAAKVVKMFPIENVEVLTDRETEDLLHYLQMIGETEPNMEVLHFTPIPFHNRILESVLGINGNEFLSMYLNVTFPGLTREDMLVPEDHMTEEELDNIFIENHLEKGRTVLLVPYANTIDPLPMCFWDYIANDLLKKGYTVCTNCDYPREKKIQGTIPLFLRYGQMKRFVEAAGAIIQIRSGLTDLLYDCHCKNYILYPLENYYRFGDNTLYEYFSLEKMGLNDWATEIEFSRRYAFETGKKIVGDF